MPHNYSLRDRSNRFPIRDGKCRCVWYCYPGRCDNAALEIDCDKRNCGSKGGCGNTAFARTTTLSDDALDERLEPLPTANNGSGLFTLRELKIHDIVCEYDGKILTEFEFTEQQSSENNSDKVAELPDGRYVDAAYEYRFCGFISHSEQPNCLLISRQIKGIEHIFIVAAQNINAGDELFLNFCGDSSSPPATQHA